MTAYEQTLRAYGFSEETARRDAWANEVGRLANVERYTYEAEALADGPCEVISYADRRGV